MQVKQRLEQQLRTVRGISEQALSVFTSPADWTFQPHPQANHALWFVGHIGMVDNFMASRIDPARVDSPAGYREKFGMGSRPSGNPADYPPVEEALAFFRARRAVVMELLAGLSDEDLAKPLPPGGPSFMTDVASVFESAAWHEALHLGQVTVARRALGHAPMADMPPRAA
ncbi:MAG: DinB family protein [Planctomycetota bacterium]